MPGGILVVLLDIFLDLICMRAAADEDFFHSGHCQKLKCVLDEWYIC